MKVSYGISNTHYAIIDPSTGRYRTPEALPGAVSFGKSGGGKELSVKSNFGTLPAKRQRDDYSGILVIASLPLAFLSDVFGIVVDAHGVEIDYGIEDVIHFALMYENNTDVGRIRQVWYDCTAELPEYSVQTNDTGITIATRQLDIKMRKNPALELRGYPSPIKARVASDKAAFNTFFDEVYGV